MKIRELAYADFRKDFFPLLECLAEVDLPVEAALRLNVRRHQHGVTTLVAEMDGKLVGTASVLIEDKFIHQGGKVAHVEDVVVHPEYRQQGIGRALIEHILDLARSRGCYKAILACEEKNISFYEKCGLTSTKNTLMRLDL